MTKMSTINQADYIKNDSGTDSAEMRNEENTGDNR